MKYPAIITTQIAPHRMDDARRWLNTQWIGKPDVNRVDAKTGQLVPVGPEPAELKEAHWRLNASDSFEITMQLQKDGSSEPAEIVCNGKHYKVVPVEPTP